MTEGINPIFKATLDLQYLIDRPMSRAHENKDCDYEDAIKSIGDYCVERVKEEADQAGNWLSEAHVINLVMKAHKEECHPFYGNAAVDQKMDAHLREYHIPYSDPWWKNLRCPIHGEKHIHSRDSDVRGIYAIGWNCGCTFKMR